MMDALREMLINMGAAQVACADISALDAQVSGGYPRALIATIALDRSIVSRIPGGPHREYSDLYVSANRQLDGIGLAAEGWLKNRDFRAWANTRDRTMYDPAALITTLPHKTVGRLAGLGWIGKSAMLVSPEYGTAFRMITVLTDAPLAPGVPMQEGRCGSCDACVRACPAGAYRGAMWRPGIERDELFDAHACRAATKRRGEEAGHPEYAVTCGLCIEACPYTLRYLRG